MWTKHILLNTSEYRHCWLCYVHIQVLSSQCTGKVGWCKANTVYYSVTQRQCMLICTCHYSSGWPYLLLGNIMWKRTRSIKFVTQSTKKSKRTKNNLFMCMCEQSIGQTCYKQQLFLNHEWKDIYPLDYSDLHDIHNNTVKNSQSVYIYMCHSF